MFAFFRSTGVQRAPVSREVPRIEWMSATEAGRLETSDPRYLIADMLDPSLMSLPNVRGFSRNVWQHKLEATQRSLGWNEQPAYLDARPPDPLHSLLEPAPLSVAALSTAEKQPAQSEEPETEATEPTIPLNRSVFFVLGPLEDRAVMRAPELPLLSGPVPVRAAQVRVGVSADGLVRYALLDRSCGNEAVDAQALELARQIRFEAETTGSTTALAWGIVRFLWATQATPSAHGESAAAQP
jgi:TonB family protein